MKTPNPQCQFFGNTRYRVYFVLSLFLLSFSNFSFSQLAFPTAEGFGKNATGGRGGQVIIVTNLNDSGTGSLRAALDASGPRTVVFEVGGTINLNSNIYVDNGDLTIAGQTAPGDGILIRGGMVQFETSNIIVRYMRFRSGQDAGFDSDAVSITAWSGSVVENIIFDHCSFSWGDDENFNMRGVGTGIVRNITIQNSIVAESTYAMLTWAGVYNVSVYRNLFALNSERNIRSNYPVSGELDFEMINNLVYGFRVATKPSLGVQFTVLNNHYKLSTQVNPINSAVVDASSSGGGTASQTHAYISGNIKPNSMSVNDSALSPYLETSPYDSSGITAIPTSSLESSLLSDIGCSYPTRDSVDERIINSWNSGTGVTATGVGAVYPVILNGAAPADTDNDGMPNAWEIENGLNVNDASDRNIVQADGYTSLEYYINFMNLGPETNHVDAGSDVTICEGDTATLTAEGADSYVWMPGNISGASIDVNPTNDTTYVVTGTFSDGSTLDDEVIVIVNPIPVANAGNDVEICQGTAVTLTANGGSGYEWNTGATTQSISVSPTSTTTYSVEVTQNGCTSAPDEVTVTVNSLPNVDAGLDVSIDYGDSTVLTANGADSYQWNTGETTQSITVNPTIETTYTVTGTTGTCQNSDSVTVFLIGSEVVANAGNDQTICNGSQATLTATGGVAYVWNTGQTTASIDVSPSTTTIYTVTAFDASGTVSDSDDVTVLVNNLPNIDAGVNVSITEGQSTTLTASGADTYEWNTGETTQSIIVSPIVDTIYTVTGFSNGCEATDDVLVNIETENVTANAGEDQTICQGEIVTLTAIGGATYQWNTGATTFSIEVNPSTTTTYTVTVFNSLGTDSDTDEVTVFVNDFPNIDAGVDVTISEGETTTLTATGGSGYEWNTGETTQSIEVSPTSTTTYAVIGTANGCQATDEVIVTVLTENVIANAGDDVVTCQGETVILTASGGATYQWNNGETTASIEVNPNITTTYTVTAFNSLGTDSDTDEVTVFVNEFPNINAGSDVTITEGESILLTATGGSGYEWNTGETTQSIEVSPTSTTTYTVIGTANGCQATDEVIVTVLTESVIANAGEDQTICEGQDVTLTASGGSTYLWNTGATTASIEVNPNSTTTYIVTAFNSLGTDSDTDEVTVFVNDFPNIDAGVDVTISEGETTTLTAIGGSGYEWNTGETTQSIEVSPTSTTTYSVIGTANGCQATDEVVVTVETENVIANAGEDQTICEGDTVTLTASGGTTYQWNTGETTSNIEVAPNSTTTYTVIVFNTLGTSSDEDQVTVFVNALPTTDAGMAVNIIEGESTILMASGADSYIWNTGETTASIEVNPLTTTLYTVTGFSNGCEVTDEVLVTVEPDVFIANAGEDQFICEGTTTTLTASEGDSYLWNTGETTQSITVSPWASEIFTVTVFEDDEQAQDDVTVFVNLNPNVVIMNGGEVTILEGEFITLSASGANTYEWNNGATQPNIAVSPTNSTTYSVTGYINNCSDDKSVTVNVVEAVEAYAGEDYSICVNETVTLTATGGEEYLWNTGETTQSIHVTPGTDTEYSVLVYNALSSDEATVMVFVNDCDEEEIPIANQEFDFLIYQDATADVLKLQISGLDRVDVDQVLIYDITGKIIYREDIKTIANATSLDKEIDSSQLSRGIYIVRLMYDDTEILKKIPIR